MGTLFFCAFLITIIRRFVIAMRDAPKLTLIPYMK